MPGTSPNLWTLSIGENGGAVRNSITITYYKEKDSSNHSSTANIAYGAEYIIAQNGFKNTGYNFSHWEDDAGNYYYPDTKWTLYNDLNLYAVWEAKEYSLDFRVYRCEYDNEGKTMQQAELASNELNSYITIESDLPSKIKYGQLFDLKITCNDYCQFQNGENIDTNLNAFFRADVTASELIYEGLACVIDKDPYIEINIYPNAYPVQLPDGETVYYYYGGTNPPTTKKAELTKIKKSGVNSEYQSEETKDFDIELKYNDKLINQAEWHKELFFININNQQIQKYNKLTYVPVYYTLTDNNILYWKYKSNDNSKQYASEEPIEIMQDTAVEIYYRLPIIHLNNTAWKDVSSGLANQLLPAEDGTTLYWSLTKRNGMPHYCSGDYISIYKTNDIYLWTTSANGKDFEIKELKSTND